LYRYIAEQLIDTLVHFYSLNFDSYHPIGKFIKQFTGEITEQDLGLITNIFEF